ncbi:MAG: hypothetical protein QOD00_2476 [Blastocatellia bacterium]|jgi:hypothetical protein|nr:hypothetical protein [Blastocatellia bacterium]
MKLKNRGKRTLAFLFIAALLNLYSNVSLAAPLKDASPNPAGELAAMGQVRVDGVLMVSGATILSGSSIRTEEKSGAIISLGQLGRMELSPGASLRLDFDRAGFMGQLETGRLRVSLPPQARASIHTRDGLVIAHDEESAALFTVEVTDGMTRVAAQAGRVELRSSEDTQQITADHEALAGVNIKDTTSLINQPQNSQRAGGGKLTGLVIAISSALAAVALIVTLHKSGPSTDLICEGVVIELSPTDDPGVRCHR